MANEQNLRPIHKGELSKEEAKRRGSNGGKKSGEARIQKRILREEILKRMSAKDWEEIVDGVVNRAKADDNAYKTFENTIGQKPVEKTQIEVETPSFKNDLNG